MKHSAKYRIWIAAGLIACAGSAWAQGAPAGATGTERVGMSQPLYVPPMRGAFSNTVKLVSPRSISLIAARMPDMPAPITA